MIEDIFFQDEGQVRITAASVGISRIRWTAVKEEEIGMNLHIEKMKRNRFDHLPIESAQGSVTEFFSTVEPNKFDEIKRSKINFEDVIPLETSIRDVIDKFASQSRTFYFLRYNRNISGLITLGNLNCKQVQVYIFSLVCDLERQLGEYVNWKLNPDRLKAWLKNKANNGEAGNKYNQILESFEQLCKLDLENKLSEHLFLVDFFKIVSEESLFDGLDYSKTAWNKLSSINELRNRIAHPTRSLIDKDNDIFKLNERIRNIEELTYRLSAIMQNR